MRNIDNTVNLFFELILISLCMLFDQQFARLLVLFFSPNDRFMLVKHSLSVLLLIFTHVYTLHIKLIKNFLC